MPKRLKNIPVSLLDPVEIRENDGQLSDAIQRKARLVQLAESLGFRRYWFMHHPPVADQGATASILLGHLAAMSSDIRIGTDLLMRSVSEARTIVKPYALLEALHPGRMEGILTGHTPSWLKEWSDIPFSKTFQYWMFGTETEHAEQAGKAGLPFAFASHFAPAHLMDALEKYRSSFRASTFLSKPYTVASVHTIVAASDEEAEHLASSLYMMLLNLLRKESKPLPAPVQLLNMVASEQEWSSVRRMLWYSFFGEINSVSHSLQTFLDQTEVDELMICSALFDERKESASLRAIADLFR